MTKFKVIIDKNKAYVIAVFNFIVQALSLLAYNKDCFYKNLLKMKKMSIKKPIDFTNERTTNN